MITKGESRAYILHLLHLFVDLRLLNGLNRPLEKESAEDDDLAYGD